MTRVTMRLGAYKFSLETAAYRRLRRSSPYRWRARELIGARPVQQYLGPGEETIELEGAVLPTFRGGLGQIDAMRKEADRGRKLMMVDGRGLNWGWWVVKQIEETATHLTADGVPRKIEFRLSLAAYGGDA